MRRHNCERCTPEDRFQFFMKQTLARALHLPLRDPHPSGRVWTLRFISVDTEEGN